MRRGAAVYRLLFGFGLVALGAGSAVLGSSSSGNISVDGPEQPIAQGARDPTDARANNSPTLVRSPVEAQRLVVVNRVDLPTYACSLHVSDDGGVTWQEQAVPFPAGEDLPERCFAPDAVFGADGALHVVFVTLKGLGNSPNAVWSSTMEREANALSTPRRILGPLAFQVRIAADPRVAGRLFLTWLQADAVGLALFPNTGNPINVIRSDNGGGTWTAPVRVSPPFRDRVVAPSLAVGDSGGLWALYLDLGGDKLDYHGGHGFQEGPAYAGLWSLVLARSSDGGRNWVEVVVDDAVVPIQRFLVFLPQTPSLAVARSGRRVHVGFADARFGDADVWVRTSDDGGARFGPRRRVNDTKPGDGTWQYLPKVALAPGGRLDVVYYDRRADHANVMNEVSFQSSFDAGRTFSPSRRLSTVAFDSRIGFGSRRGLPDLGSRLGLLAGKDRTLAVWADTRAGNAEARKQDLAVAAVSIDEPRQRAGLRNTGWAAAVTGLGLLASSLPRFRRGGVGGIGSDGARAAEDEPCADAVTG